MRHLLSVLWLSCFLCITRGGGVRKIEFVSQPKNQVSIENKIVTFECSASATPYEKLAYLWKKDGRYMDMNSTRASISAEGSLVINRIGANDFGSYECVAMSDNAAVISQPAKLDKAVLSWSSQRYPPVQVKEGGYHLFVSSLKTNVDVILEWKMCSFSQSICKDLDSSRTHVTADKNLLISPILASDDTFYPRLTVSGGGFSGVNLNLNEIRIVEYLPSNWKYRCPDTRPVFLETKDFTVSEGEDLTIDCLAVMQRCSHSIVVKWTDWRGHFLDNSRKLKLVNVKKMHQGQYKCTIEANGDPSHSFSVQVIEKPQIISERPESSILGLVQIVSPAQARGADSIEWYTTAERITTGSRFYEIMSNHSLKILPKSAALGGLYQIIYRNKAGVLMRTVKVEITDGICGKRYNDDTGHIKFLRPLGLPDKRVRCVWIIQASSAAKLKFYFTAFMLKSSCAETFINIYDGHDERNSTQNYHFCAASLPTGIFELKGPFITVYLTGNGTTLAKEGFSLLYGPAITIPTTSSAATTTRAFTTKSTTTTSKATTTTTTMTSSTKQSTKQSTVSGRSSTETTWSRGTGTRRSTLNGTIFTSRTSPITNGSTTQRKSSAVVSTVVISTSQQKEKSSTEDKSITKPIMTTADPKQLGKDSPKKSKTVIVAVVIVVIFVFIIIIIIIAIVRYRRQKLGQMGSKNATTDGFWMNANKSSCNEKQRGTSDHSKETCFTVNGRPRAGHKGPFPDVVPETEPVRYQQINTPFETHDVIENYTALKFDDATESQQYTALSFKDLGGNYESLSGPTYAVVLPEADAQYTPSSDVSLGQDRHCSRSDQVNTQAGCPSYPVYQELEIEADSQHGGLDNPTTTFTESGSIIEHTYAETIPEAVYSAPDEKAPVRSQRFSLNEEKRNRAQMQNNEGYLVPIQSVKLPNRRTQEVMYSPTHYIKPNPVDQKWRTTKAGKDNVKGFPVASSEGGPGSREENNKSQLITADDDMYLAIMT